MYNSAKMFPASGKNGSLWSRIKLENLFMNISEIEKNKKHLISGSDLPKYLLDEIFNYLPKKEKLIGVEYRIFCWLISQYHYPCDLELDLPKIANPKAMEEEEFVSKYVNSDRRKELYSHLKDLAICITETHGIKKFKVLIGGSYTDQETPMPNDLDAALLVPQNEIGEYYCNERFYLSERLLAQIGCDLNLRGKLDFAFVSIDSTVKKFRTYNRLVLLSNLALKKDKDKLSNQDNSFVLGENKFTLRDVIELDFTKETNTKDSFNIKVDQD